MKQYKSNIWGRVWQRIRLMGLLILLGLSVSITMVPAAEVEYHIYALKSGDKVDEIEYIYEADDFSYEGSGFYFQTLSGKAPQAILREGQPVTIHTHDDTITVESRFETLTNLLHRMNVNLDNDDMIVFDMTSENPDITLATEFRYLRYVETSTSYDTKHVDNPLMYRGDERVAQKGKAGTIIETYEDTYRGGTLAGCELVKRTNRDTVTEIIEHGTRVDSVSSARRVTGTGSKDGVNYLIFDNGDTMTYSYVTTCSATAYSGGRGTASGMALGAGTVAVDPSVFPYGTRFYIYASDGSWVYGMGTAKDCGGSIKNNKIDLWFNSYGTSCEWGRRDCTVYVLN